MPGSGRRLGVKHLFSPPAAKGFDELNVGDQSLAGKLSGGALRVQRVAARIDDFIVADNARGIALGGQLLGAQQQFNITCPQRKNWLEL